MNTVKIRWLGAKKNKVVDLPIGLASIGEKTGEVVCNPVGEFPAGEANKLLSMPGASKLYVLESEYQAAHAPKPASKPEAPAAKVKKAKPVIDDAKRQAMLDRVKKMNEAKAAKKAAAEAATAA